MREQKTSRRQHILQCLARMLEQEPGARITTAALARPAGGEELRETVLTMISSPQLASRKWIVDQFDRYARGNTVQAEGADAGVVRVDEATGRGIAVSADTSGRYTQLDPYRGAQLALAEAYRNVATAGAVPLAVTDCLNFGSPEDPGPMWQLVEAIGGLADGCQELGVPVTGGNVSLYNSTGEVGRIDSAIHPTPVIGVLGVLDDVTVSRRHVEFHRETGGFSVRDVGSLNGTYVNREQVDVANLAGGDEVQIGKFRLVYLTGPRTGEPAAR